jgi:hypothetical protein
VVVACRSGDEAAVKELVIPTIEAPLNGRQLEELAERRTATDCGAPDDAVGA